MAMLPFCGYHMGDYFAHWIDMGKRMTNPPKIFNVNWFRTNDKGEFIWPGFGDNMRVLMWILDRCEGKVDAQAAPIGWLPYAKDIDTEGLAIEDSVMDDLLSVDKRLWEAEIDGIEEFYAKFDRLPDKLRRELSKLRSRIESL